MLGAIIGDISGSRFQWYNIKTKVFELFNEECKPTDDSVMTLAIAKAILSCNSDFSQLERKAIRYMQQLGRNYPYLEYGVMFYEWLNAKNPRPYNSFGNGAAMRVSPCGFAAKTIEEAISLSKAVTRVTHNHPEGLKAAEAVTSAIFLAKNGKSLTEIREHIEKTYYKINFTLEQIRPIYSFDVTCQGSVPQAFAAFFESTDFEDAIRNAISIGGDSDTIAAITGGMAEAYYGIPSDIREKALAFLDADLAKIVHAFEKKYGVNKEKVSGKVTNAEHDDAGMGTVSKSNSDKIIKTERVPINEEDFLRIIEKMYSEYTIEDIRCHIELNFRYSSFWVLPEMTSAGEYIDYITGKVQALKETNSVIKTKMMHFMGSKKPCLVLEQDTVSESVCLFVERSANGLIARMDMMPAGFYRLVP